MGTDRWRVRGGAALLALVVWLPVVAQTSGSISVPGPLPSGYSTFCAFDSTCTVPASPPLRVYYGVIGQPIFFYRDPDPGPLTCSTAVFGDPVPGQAKTCYSITRPVLEGEGGWTEPQWLQVIAGVLLFFAVAHGFVTGRAST